MDPLTKAGIAAGDRAASLLQTGFPCLYKDVNPDTYAVGRGWVSHMMVVLSVTDLKCG